MAICPLCSERSAKRYCPAKEAQICAVCCGAKREVEIDCPGNCVYLKAARSYEAEKTAPDPELVAKIQKYGLDFFNRYAVEIELISRSVVEERLDSTWLVDNDVIEVYRSLTATMKTLSSGIHYESMPEGPVRISLFRRLRAVLDQLMGPREAGRSALRVSEAVNIMDFLTYAAQANTGLRPRSRRYLDWLDEMVAASAPRPETSGGLIVP
jgi:hypothetical protein